MAQDISHWDNRWKEGRTGWNQSKVNHILKTFYEHLLSGREASKVRIFVPLCGKTIDMKWLYDLGHSVVGVEAVPKPVEEFFNDHSISYTKGRCESVEGGAIKYESKDGRLTIFVCDFFKIDVGCTGLVDGVWDRSSLVAIELSMQEQYIKTMLPLMAPGCKYLLETVEYDHTKRSGPPHAILRDEVHVLFSGLEIRVLLREVINPENKPGWASSLDSVDRGCYLIQN